MYIILHHNTDFLIFFSQSVLYNVFDLLVWFLIYFSVCPIVFLSVCLIVFLSVCLFLYSSITLSNTYSFRPAKRGTFEIRNTYIFREHNINGADGHHTWGHARCWRIQVETHVFTSNALLISKITVLGFGSGTDTFMGFDHWIMA